MERPMVKARSRFLVGLGLVLGYAAFLSTDSFADPPEPAPAVADCDDATTAWTGTAGDGLWNTAGNWSGGQRPLATDAVCIPVASTVVATSSITVRSIDGQGRLEADAGLTVTSTTEHSRFYDLAVGSGNLAGRVYVPEYGEAELTGAVYQAGELFIDGDVDILGNSQVSGQVRNRGHLEVNQGSLRLNCQATAPSGLRNEGTVVLSGNAPRIDAGSAPSCKPTVWNEPDGLLVGLPVTTAQVSAALVNEGEVVAGSGMLSLTDGSEYSGWFEGVASSSGDGAATGLFYGDGGVVEFYRGTFHFSQSMRLDGDIQGANDATLTSTVDVTLEPTANLRLNGASLEAKLIGGRVLLNGLLKADIGRGDGESSRRLEGWLDGDISVDSNAEVVLSGHLKGQPNAKITNNGTVYWPANYQLFQCDSCGFVNNGELIVQRTYTGLNPQVATIAGGFWNTNGDLIVEGSFPGVSIAVKPSTLLLSPFSLGSVTYNIGIPSEFSALKGSQSFALTAGAVATNYGDVFGLLVRRVTTELASLVADDFGVGMCKTVSMTLLAGTASVQGCNVRLANGHVGVTFSFGMGATSGVGSIASIEVNSGVAVPMGIGVPLDDIYDLEGLSSCVGFSAEVFVGVEGVLCHARSNGVEYPLMPVPGSSLLPAYLEPGINTIYGGLSASVGPDVAATVGLSYTIALDCSAWEALVNGGGPLPPEGTSMTSPSGEAGTPVATQTLTIYGERLSPCATVYFETDGWSQRANTVLPPGYPTSCFFYRGSIEVEVPTSDIPRVVNVVVQTSAGRSDEFFTNPAVTRFTYYAGP